MAPRNSGGFSATQNGRATQNGYNTSNSDQEPQFGLVSHTLVPTPMAHQILPCRLRDINCNDLVFVGHDFIRVKEFQDGHLIPIASKADFPAPIRAARVFGESRPAPGIKQERGVARASGLPSATRSVLSSDRLFPPDFPPQALLLTLANNELWSLCLRPAASGEDTYFCISKVALPSHRTPLLRPGKCLAVDFKSRAVAVAAAQARIVLYTTKRDVKPCCLSDTEPQEWMPIKDERILHVEGPIVRMEFLHPAPGDVHHVILLVLHYVGGDLCATCWDWDDSQQLPIPLDKRVNAMRFTEHPHFPQLMIPLNWDSSFILVTRDGLKLYKNILSGELTIQNIGTSEDRHSRFPQTTARPPIRTNWVRMPRHDSSIEHYYIVREDGALEFLEIKHEGKITRPALHPRAGQFGGFIGSAFAGIPTALDEADYLIGAGDGTAGALLAIGYRSGATLGNQGRSDVMTPRVIEPISNWSPITDLAKSDRLKHDASRLRPRDELIITTGRDPFGSLSVVRHGVSTKAFYNLVDTADIAMHGATRLWLLSNDNDPFIALLITSPSGSSCLRLELQQRDGEDIIELSQGPSQDDEQQWAIEHEHPTLAACPLPKHRYLQITSSGIRVFDGRANQEIRTGHSGLSPIVAAGVSVSSQRFVAAYRADTHIILIPGSFAEQVDPDHVAVPKQIHHPPAIEEQPTCISIFSLATFDVAIVSTREGTLAFYKLYEPGLECLAKFTIASHLYPDDDGETSSCESIEVIRSTQGTAVVVCGMRDGTIRAVELFFDPPTPDVNAMDLDKAASPPSWYSLRLGNVRIWKFNESGIPVQLYITDLGIIATSGALSWETWVLQRIGEEGCHFHVQCLWLDKSQYPALDGKGMSAFLPLPQNPLFAHHGLSDALLLIHGDTILATWPDATPSTITQDIPVQGTPQRVIMDSRRNALVASNAPNGASGKMESSLVYINPWAAQNCQDDDEASLTLATFQLSKFETVRSLHAWEFKNSSDRRTYEFLAVGTEFMTESENKPSKGRILFLRITKGDDGIMLKQARKPLELSGPVNSIDSDDNKIVYGSGKSLFVMELTPVDNKLQELVVLPLPSPAVCITTSSISEEGEGKTISIRVTTLAHSLRTFLVGRRMNEWTVLFTGHDSVARQGLSHVSVLRPQEGYTLVSDKMNSMTLLHTTTQPSVSDAARTILSVSMPRAIIRLQHQNIRPWWLNLSDKGSNFAGACYIGAAADGTIYAFGIISRIDFYVLKILEQLVILRKHTVGPIGERNDDTATDAQRMIFSIGALLMENQDSDNASRKLGQKHWHVNADLIKHLVESSDTDDEIEKLLTDVENGNGDRAEPEMGGGEGEQSLRWVWAAARRRFDQERANSDRDRANLYGDGSATPFEQWIIATLMTPF